MPRSSRSLALALLAALLTLAAARGEKPNVLLICVDDLKPTLGCYGDPMVKSPNIDRLAASGVLFERAYCNQAVCSPSRNALLTSLRPQTLGIYDLQTNFRRARPDAVTLPQYFKQHGYRTEALGKIFHVGHGNTDDAASWSVPSWRAPAPMYARAQASVVGSAAGEDAPKAKRGAKDGKGAAYESADVPDDTYADGQLAEEAIRRLRTAREKADEPFFLAVGFLKPHLPFVAPKRYWDLYDRAKVPLAEFREPPVGAPEYAPQFGGELRQYTGLPAVRDLPEDVQRTLIHGYYAATSYTDAQIGKVLAELDRLGLARNTIVVLWGDHGWHLGDHSMWCKHTNYENAARIPLLISAPGAKSGVKTTSFAESVDVYPTLCELAGLPAPVEAEGRSLAPTLRDPAAPTKDHVIHVYPRNERIGRAIRTARYRLVEWKKPGTASSAADLELYDYEADPLERRNLAGEQPEVVAKLSAILARYPEAKPQLRSGDGAANPKTAGDKPKQSRAEVFVRRDKDGDGKLTRAEFLLGQPDPDEAPKRFPLFDANKDGVLSREEFVTSGGKNPNAK